VRWPDWLPEDEEEGALLPAIVGPVARRGEGRGGPRDALSAGHDAAEFVLPLRRDAE